MTRSVLQPLRPRRVATSGKSLRHETNPGVTTLTPGTRQTLAAIGALWVSFAVTSSGKSASCRTPLKRAESASDDPAEALLLAGVSSLPR